MKKDKPNEKESSMENLKVRPEEEVRMPLSGEAEVATEVKKAAEAVAQVEAETEEHSTKLKEMEDRYLRLAAEFDNFRKRTAREFQAVIRAANARILWELLELSDNFERALSSPKEKSESLRQGVELINNQLKSFLKKEEVEELDVANKPFDPVTAEAVMQMESAEPEGEVIEVLSKGYALGGQVLRPAKVVVSKGASVLKSEQKSIPE